jgi:hypothetical protein
MRKLAVLISFLLFSLLILAQDKSSSKQWKTFFIKSTEVPAPPKPSSAAQEIWQVLSVQQQLDSAGKRKILYWNAGPPGYRWYELMSKLWMRDTTYNGAVASMLMSVAIYDATLIAWDRKYSENRKRPYELNKQVKVFVPKPESPGYPCEYSVAAGAGATIIEHFFPTLGDSVKKLAKEMMDSRVAAGVAFPGDTRAGFDLGVQVALKGIEFTKDFATKESWANNRQPTPGTWIGDKPHFPLAGKNKTVLLDSASQFRPPAPPDFAKEMAELRKQKHTFRTLSNAFYWASGSFWGEYLDKKILEYNIHFDPLYAAWLYAVNSIGIYDGFVACWDAKYTYWGIRPSQYDTTYRPALMVTPPFPGYPSGHAVVSGVLSELYAYFFPEDRAYLEKKAKDAAESRFQAGIHFRSDNEVGLSMGKKIGQHIINKLKSGDDRYRQAAR